jgi:hypothetical protein
MQRYGSKTLMEIGLFDRFIVLGLLQASHQRNMRWQYPRITLKFYSVLGGINKANNSSGFTTGMGAETKSALLRVTI